MADAPAALHAAPKRDWRRRENRKKDKSLIKRVSQDEQKLVNWYAKDINCGVSDLLDPAVQQLLALAREHLAAKEKAGDQSAAALANELAIA